MRVSGWAEALVQEVEAAERTEFCWGSHDCCQWVRRVAYRLSGRDFGLQFRPYDSEFGAMRLVAEYGGIEQLLTAAFGESKPAGFARRGDVVLADFGRGPQPSICLGAVCVAPGERELERRATSGGLMAWSI